MPYNPSSNSGNTFSPEDLAHISAVTPIQQVEFHPELASTNDLALEIATKHDYQFPLLVLTNSQTAGRGRRTNLWWSTEGALTFSLVLETSAEQLPTSRWPQASLTVGLAICEALEELLAGPEFLIKWPNDVYVGERKISGVLVETPSQQTNKLVLGIGINVNNSLGTAPAEISNSAIALCDMTDRQFTLTDVLVAVLNNLVERLGWIGTQDNELRKRWQNRCLLTNRRVEVDSDAGLVAGICQGTDEEGALLVRTDRGVRRCLAGSITLLN